MTPWRRVPGAVVVVAAFAASGCAGPRVEGSRGPRWTSPTPERIVEPKTDDGVSVPGLTHVLQGLYLLGQGKADGALPHLRLGLMYDPASAFLHERLAVAWRATGKIERAATVVNQGLDRHPGNPYLRAMAGQTALRERRFADAVEHLSISSKDGKVAIMTGALWVDAQAWAGDVPGAVGVAQTLAQRFPSEAPLFLGMAAVLEDHGRQEEALAFYRQASRQQPGDPRAALSESRLAELAGEYAAAADRLVDLFSHFPDAPELHVRIAALLRQTGSEDAQVHWEEALRLTEGDPIRRLGIALRAQAEGRREEAMVILKAAVDELPGEPEPLRLLAVSQFEDGEYRACLATLGQGEGTLSAAPGSPAGPWWFRLKARCAAAVGDTGAVLTALVRAHEYGATADEALADAARVLGGRQAHGEVLAMLDDLTSRLGDGVTDAGIRWARAIAADLAGRGEEALGYARETGRQPGASEDILRGLADFEARLGDMDAALGILEKQLDESPQDAVRLNALGFTLADANRDLDRALVYLRRAYRLEPEEGAIVDSLGWVLYRRGDLDKAHRLLEKASRLSPGDPEILRHLGDVVRDRGDRKRAREYFREALRHRPLPNLKDLIQKKLREVSASGSPGKDRW